MARKGFFDTIFSGLTARMDLHQTWVMALEESDQAERDKAQRLLDYYNRDREAIVAHLTLAAKKTFGDQVSDWHWPIVNGVARVIKRLSLAYLTVPERKLVRGDTVFEPGSAEYEMIFGENGLYSAIDIDRKLKEVDRYSTLLNTCHVEVVPRGGLIDWDIRLRPGVIVVENPDDYLQFSKIAYEYNPLDPETLAPRTGWVYWTEDEHKYIMADGEVVGMSLENGANPYGGKIPIVTIRKIAQDAYWGAFGADMVDGFEHAALQLANLWENAFMQTHGQPVGTNLGLKQGETLVTGCKNPILCENVGKEDVPPSLVFVSPEPKIQEVRDLIDWFIKSVGQSYGLPPASWSLDAVAESGFAKFMNNIELLEDRDDSQSLWVKVEQELFENSRMVWNRWATENGKKQIPDDITLQVTFQPVRLPEAPVDKATRYAMGIKAGTTSPVRYFMEEEGLERDDAIAKAKEIDEENKMFRSEPAADFMSGFLGGKNEPAPEPKPEPDEGEEE